MVMSGEGNRGSHGDVVVLSPGIVGENAATDSRGKVTEIVPRQAHAPHLYHAKSTFPPTPCTGRPYRAVYFLLCGWREQKRVADFLTVSLHENDGIL